MKIDSKTDITVNVTAHRENILLYKTLRGVRACVEFAQARGLKVEMNISLDNTDEETRRVVTDFVSSCSGKMDITVHDINVGDLAKSRNYLIEHSSGKYIAFFDADDFFTENYLHRAFEFAKNKQKPACYIAKYMVNFESDHYIIKLLDSTNKEISKRYLFETNYFISQAFISREIYEEICYQPNTNGYGFEDWHFNSEVIAHGYEMFTVPDTIFFYRRKKAGSMLAGQAATHAVMRASTLLKPENFTQLTPKVKKRQKRYKVSLWQKYNPVTHYLSKHPFVRHYVITVSQLNRSALRALGHKAARLFGQRPQTDEPWDVFARRMAEEYKHTVPDRLKEIGLTRSAINYWGKINAFEPMIRASWDILEYIPILQYPTESPLSEAYYKLCKEYGTEQYDDLVLVPHMVRGGAEQATLHLVRSLSKRGRRVMVFATLHTDSPWAKKVRAIENVVFVESKDIFRNIVDEDARIAFLIKVIENWSFKTVSVINSEIGYKLLIRYGKVLKDIGCRSYLHTYAFDMTEDGYVYNYIPNGLVDSYAATDMLITDSEVYRDKLISINGFDAKKVRPLYLPINPAVKPKRSYRQTKKVLWASRVSIHKLPDVALEVASYLEDYGVELHFYGTLDSGYAKDDMFIKSVVGHANAYYHGLFEGFQVLNLDKYDMFLLTTRNEGMANVILESCAANIFIIAPAVGGIPECVDNTNNGYLVKDENKFEPKKYADAILSAYATMAFTKQSQIDMANDRVRQRHSLENYDKTVGEIMLGDAA